MRAESHDPLQDSAFAQLYAQVQQFYARHLQVLDSGSATAWAETFAEDGSLDLPGAAEPVRGRAAIVESMSRSAAAFAAAGETRRHWHGMLDVTERLDGSIGVRCYALVFRTVRDNPSTLHRVCVCEDVLVREDGVLKVRTRRVTRDDSH
ncbi:nuclear transport factor 2 family protein [Amycolatopsis sp. VC5-11]|uniref:nuclear transport factor 2 family protein n=1 Tax=Amycolatopsis sp. VC5-11 TaxID=3120156 RepID=UPI00300A10C1